MHEEYRPGYNWEDMINKEFKKTIPWGDVEDSSEEPDTTYDCEEPDSWILAKNGQRFSAKKTGISEPLLKSAPH